MPPDEFVARSGNVMEHGVAVSPGLRELRISAERIFLQTTLGPAREFQRSQVRTVRIGRRRWTFGKWFSVELEDGTIPDIYFGGSKKKIRDALTRYGWPLEEY